MSIAASVTFAPLATFQMLIVGLSVLRMSAAAASSLPSGENASFSIFELPTAIERSSWPLSGSKNLIVPSYSPEARILPLGEKASDAEYDLISIGRRLPLATSHNCKSPVVVASVRLSGENATPITRLGPQEKTWTRSPVAAFHTIAWPFALPMSIPPVAIHFPSGE